MPKFTRQLTFSLSTEECMDLEKLAATRPGKTPDELVHQALRTGLWHLVYRGKRNKQQAEKVKIANSLLKMVNNPRGLDPKAVRALAIAAGLAVPEADDVVECTHGDEFMDGDICTACAAEASAE